MPLCLQVVEERIHLKKRSTDELRPWQSLSSSYRQTAPWSRQADGVQLAEWPAFKFVK